MKKLFDTLKRCEKDRKDYKLKFSIKFDIDRRHYYFAFIPTVRFVPWVYRYPNTRGVIDIWWLNFHVLIGTWEHRDKNG